MRSVTAKILLWCFGTLVFSWAAFIATSYFVARRAMREETNPPADLGTRQLDRMARAYESGGTAKLSAGLQDLHRFLNGRYHLLDPNGKDLATGEDRSALVAGLRPGETRVGANQAIVFFAAEDPRYRLIWLSSRASTPAANFQPTDLVPYYVLILIAVAALCWVLAVNIASPLRVLGQMVERFGAGDLGARVHSRRKDEIGNLGRAFDRMAERIETLLTAERRLLQDISHELRSPLARLSFAAELTRTAEDRDAAVGRIRKEISRLTNLVGALIQVTRAEGDPSLHHPEQVQLDELIYEVVEDCRVEAETRGCRIAVQVSRPVVTLGDRELLRRAVENILHNAIRYSPDTATVDLNLSTSSGVARLAVRDYGPGVPEEVLPRIFQPFFRVDDSRDNATGGVGLGLAIAHRAIGLHHGRLWAENSQPGLRVWMEVPLVE
ncbi:MAG TPA: ATP-binding protein [Bryobacteraceae bacterium]|nr:ATP-binding protein [Bryobacteraceae bacterium]